MKVHLGERITGSENMITFDRMVTPALVQVFWIVGLGGSFGAGFAGAAFIRYTLALDPAVAAIGGVVIAVASTLILRLVCEAMIVVFRIHSSLVQIREELTELRTRATIRGNESSAQAESLKSLSESGSIGP